MSRLNRLNTLNRLNKLSRLKVLLVTLLAVAVFCTTTACSAAQASAHNALPEDRESSSSIYGNEEDSSNLAETQLMQTSGTGSSGVGSVDESDNASAPGTQFRNTGNGEPLAIHQFVNRVLVDDEYVLITLHSKTADELGDAGFTLQVVNRYEPLTSVGFDNYCYITPVMGTWSVNGVKVDPKAEGHVYPGVPNTIYLYFDELNSIEELVTIEGTFEVFRISDWWNPVGVYAFSQS